MTHRQVRHISNSVMEGSATTLRDDLDMWAIYVCMWRIVKYKLVPKRVVEPISLLVAAGFGSFVTLSCLPGPIL